LDELLWALPEHKAGGSAARGSALEALRGAPNGTLCICRTGIRALPVRRTLLLPHLASNPRDLFLPVDNCLDLL